MACTHSEVSAESDPSDAGMVPLKLQPERLLSACVSTASCAKSKSTENAQGLETRHPVTQRWGKARVAGARL